MSTSKTKTLSALFIAFVLLLSLTACALLFPDGTSGAVSIEGDTLTIALEENPTTGFCWSYTISDENVIHLVEDGYTAESNDPNVVGGGGMHQYTFEGLKAGEVTLVFDYYKSWEGVETAEEHIEYIVTVQDDGTISKVK
ncbi:protease inhibitor I42 family protein [Proteiniclasticum sp. C24MP]|uniref:protease inhibitor I42 family protein n=1 Tax=Proteiniclasticum sp. C24MP TaxID=3374101 RepID=UPI003753F55A